jgi:hypothetical protein
LNRALFPAGTDIALLDVDSLNREFTIPTAAVSFASTGAGETAEFLYERAI